MGLNWNLTEIKNSEDCWLTLDEDCSYRGKAGDRYLKPITETFIWLTMSTGIPKITAKTAPEFLARVRILETVYGTMLTRHQEDGTYADQHVTAEDVYRHIGLSTNASSITKAEFTKRIYASLLNKTSHEFEQLSD